MLRTAPAIALVSLAFVLGACSISERVVYNDHEGPIPNEIFKKIKKNKTEKSWVTGHLGEPFAIDSVPSLVLSDDMNLTEVYTYRFHRESVQVGHLLYFFRVGANETQTEYFHVAFENELVIKAWMDKFSRPQMGVRSRASIAVNPEPVALPQTQTEIQLKPDGWKLPAFETPGSNQYFDPSESVTTETVEQNPSADTSNADQQLGFDNTRPVQSGNQPLVIKKEPLASP